MSSHEKHIKKLIVNKTRRLQILKEQQAIEGRSFEPANIIEMQDIEGELVHQGVSY